MNCYIYLEQENRFSNFYSKQSFTDTEAELDSAY